eukprot:TRINITY_DN298_c0_g1_i1.p1 TRINITY_DN298_c0_g1~~TRINITY_DN298_c0_g1_i1.p1  ORF type:complete len:160 (-),score=39.03 TRINITY_DN298_c0_g1_i1:254-733(-)
MKEWFVAGFFSDELFVKRVNDTDWQRICDKEEFQHLERRPHEQVYVPMVHENFEFNNAEIEEPQEAPAELPSDSDYTQSAFFTNIHGRFAPTDQESHWKKRGLPTDKDGRMLSHYMDIEAYQEMMRNREPLKKKKVTKSMLKHYQKKKEDKKRRRFLMM